MSTKQLPRSNATNAYDLLSDVIRCVEEEPRRLDMEVVTCPSIGPPCGTVGCVAGWTTLLAAGEFEFSCAPARNVLIDGDRKDDAVHRDLSALFYEDFPDADPGTPAYVAHVVARIRAFQSKHEAALRARKLPERSAAKERA